MRLERLTASLERSALLLDAVVSGLSGDDARWRPEPRVWSALDIACHLLDEETRDFRPRLESTLRDPDAAWTPIDPEGWVIQHGYATRDLAQVWRSFREERRASLAWLRGLGALDWTVSHDRGAQGPLSAGDLLAAWTAHDLLHLRQLTRLLYLRVCEDAQPHTPDYAGPWR